MCLHDDMLPHNGSGPHPALFDRTPSQNNTDTEWKGRERGALLRW